MRKVSRRGINELFYFSYIPREYKIKKYIRKTTELLPKIIWDMSQLTFLCENIWYRWKICEQGTVIIYIKNKITNLFYIKNYTSLKSEQKWFSIIYYKHNNKRRVLEDLFVIDIKIIKDDNNIEIYNCGVLIIEESNYNEIVLTIKEALTIIKDDLYQIEVLKSVLKQIEDVKRMVA